MSKLSERYAPERNLLYRDHYRRVVKGIIALSVTALVMIVILVGLMFTTPQPKYYATTTAGQVVPMHSLSEPVVTNDYLLQWASLATRTALNIRFAHYEEELNSAQSDFTTAGWSHFVDAMKNSGLLDTVVSKKLDMSAVVSGTPVILNTGVVHGRFTWRVKLPVLVTFTSASQTLRSRWIVTMNIQRISTLDAYKGIQIDDFSAQSQI